MRFDPPPRTPPRRLSRFWLEAVLSTLTFLQAIPSRAEAPAVTTTPAEAAKAASAPGLPWMHDVVQRAPDPAVRFGRLPNGLRYALQHNETPKDGIAMRLRIGSGSLQERDGEEGLAHFLEHMAFRGSAKVADGEVVHMLQRQGLAFGPDTNAFTAHDQTVYHFNFPRADAAALETGLLLFREVAEHLKLDPQLIEQEKGVVLSEERASDVPARRAQKTEVAQSLAGTLVPQRWPIGRTKSIEAATAEKLRRYYAANYRPDNATLVIVGNIDVDAVERLVKAQFSDWKPAGQADALAMGHPQPKEPAAEVVAEGLPDMLSLTWLLPPDIRAPRLDVERERLFAQLAMAVVNVHLADRALKPGSPYVQAFAMRQDNIFRVAAQAKLLVVAPPEQWPAALDAALAELRQLLAHGVSAEDLQRVLPQVRSALQAAVGQSATRQHAAIADALVKAAHEDEVFHSAQQTLALAEPMLAAATPDQVTQALRRSFGGGAPLLFRSARSGAAGADALSQQLAQALHRPIQAQAAATAVTWPYTDFGKPSAVTSQTTDAATGITTVEFSNGARLLVRSTAQEKDKVAVQVLLGQGRAGLKPGQTHALWALDAFPLGGTGQRSLAELMQWVQTTGKQLNVRAAVEPRAFVLLGDTRPADLLAQMQVLAAYAQDPGFRPELGDKLKAAAPMLATQFEAVPGVVYGRELVRVMSGGDARLAGPPTGADLAATRPEDLPAVLRDPLAGAPDVVIVGDVSVDASIAAMQATFAAGDARGHGPQAALQVHPAADGGAPHVVQHAGRADQAVIGWHWAMPDHWADPMLAVTGKVAAAVLQARLVDTVRSQLGITYSPNASSAASIDVAGMGSFSAQLETPPEKFEAFRQLLKTQLSELAAQPVSADELLRARQPLIEKRRKAEETNGHWSYWLAKLAREPRARGVMLAEVEQLQGVTADGVHAFFRDRIGSRAPIEVVAKAKGDSGAK